MALYFMRHAQTPGNAANVWVGRKNEGITEKGKVELKQAAQALSDIAFDYIYTSPLRRALETANAVALAQSIPPVIRIRDGLQERDFGCYEGRLKTAEHRKALECEKSVEPLASMQERIKLVLEETEALHGNILLVSHSAVFRCMVQTMNYKTDSFKEELDNVEWVRLVSMEFVCKSGV